MSQWIPLRILAFVSPTKVELSLHAGLELAGRYVLHERLGNGGMGEVWRGLDRQLDRPVAVKMIRERLSDPELVERFQREARIAAKLQHPGIAVVHDVGSDSGRLFIIMELMHGRDLASVLADSPGGLPVATAISLAIKAAEALQAAHLAHVIHRDLKPANLFLLSGGHLKICDFGIARAADATAHLTSTGQVIGTPAYMSPEQCEGQAVDGRSDLYSLGCVLYELIAGQPPFTGEQPLVIMLQHLNTAPPSPRRIRPDIPAELDAFTLSLLAKDPALRPPTASDVAATLHAMRDTIMANRTSGASAPTRHVPAADSQRPGSTESTRSRAPRSSPARPSAKSVPAGPFAVIANERDGTVTMIDLIAGTPSGQVRVGQSPRSIAITPDGSTACIANYGDGTIAVLRSGALAARITVGRCPRAVGISPDGATAYAVSYSDGTVTPVNLTTGMPGRPIRGVRAPRAIAIDPAGFLAYVVSDGRDVVTPIDLHAGAVARPIRVGAWPYAIAIAPDGTKAYVASHSDVTVVDLASGRPITRIRPAGGHQAMALTPDGSRAYLTNHDKGTMAPLELATGTLGAPIRVGLNPTAIAITPDGTTACVINGNEKGTVTLVQLATGIPDAPIKVGAIPSALAIAVPQ